MPRQSISRYTVTTAAGQSFDVTAYGEVIQGVTDAQGATQLLQKDAMHIAHVHLRDST